MSTNDLVTLTIGILLPLLVGLSVAAVWAAWNRRYEHQTHRIRIGDSELTVTGYSPEQTEKIMRQWIRDQIPVLQIPGDDPTQSAMDRLETRLAEKRTNG